MQVVTRYCLGLLYVNFKFVWEGAMEVLRIEAQHAPERFWPLFIDRLRRMAELTNTVEAHPDGIFACGFFFFFFGGGGGGGGGWGVGGCGVWGGRGGGVCWG